MGQQPHGLLPVQLMLEHAEIDAQHNDIFCQVEAIKAASLLDGDEASVLLAQELAGLVRFFGFHFATEERLAEEAGLDFEAHRREHQKNLRLLDKACAEQRLGKLDLRTFLRYLEYWFEHHINEYDKPFGERLLGHGAQRLLARPGNARVELSA